MPQCQPKRPAMGASVVPNSAASRNDGSAAPNGLNSEPRNTPAMIGTMFRGCLPNAANPTMVRIAPMTGPLRSPPTASTYSVPTAPASPMLASVGPNPAMATKSVGAWPASARIRFRRDGSARSKWKPSATIDVNSRARKPPSSALLPAVQIITGSGMKP